MVAMVEVEVQEVSEGRVASQEMSYSQTAHSKRVMEVMEDEVDMVEQGQVAMVDQALVSRSPVHR